MALKREKIYIYGRHAVIEILNRMPHAIDKVYAVKGALPLETRQRIAALKIPLAPFDSQRGVARDAVHQGCAALIAPNKVALSLETFLAQVDMTKNPSVVLLDELTDPHNVGAIIRSAAAFGASAVVLASERGAPFNATIVKVSAGAAFTIPLVVTDNLAAGLRALRKHGFKAYGLAMQGSQDVQKVTFDSPSLFIVGNEGRGMHPALKAQCDGLLRIPTSARVESLNAAASAAVVLYEWSTKTPHPPFTGGQTREVPLLRGI